MLEFLELPSSDISVYQVGFGQSPAVSPQSSLYFYQVGAWHCQKHQRWMYNAGHFKDSWVARSAAAAGTLGSDKKLFYPGECFLILSYKCHSSLNLDRSGIFATQTTCVKKNSHSLYPSYFNSNCQFHMLLHGISSESFMHVIMTVFKDGKFIWNMKWNCSIIP